MAAPKEKAAQTAMSAISGISENIAKAKESAQGEVLAALHSIESALADLKNRAKTVDGHLKEEFSHILEAIKEL